MSNFLRSKTATGIQKETETCRICFNRMHNPRKLPCAHVFCFNCIQTLVGCSPGLRVHILCPACRVPFTITVPPIGNSDLPSYIHEKYRLDILGIKEHYELPSRSKVMGMAIIKDDLFVVCKDPPNIIFRYDIGEQTPLLKNPMELSIPEMTWPRGLAASENLSCLYVTDWHSMSRGRLWRYKYGKGQNTQMEGPVGEVDHEPFGVSVSPKNDLVLVTCAESASLLIRKAWIYVYRPRSDEQLDQLKIIDIHGLKIPRHSVLTMSSRYFVCHGWTTNDHGVTSYLEDEDGKVRRKSFYGKWAGGSAEQDMNRPLSMTLDEDGLILVVDYNNHRIQLLTEDLQLVRHLLTKEQHGIKFPRHVCQHPATGRMYVGLKDGTVKVFKARDV